jgi:hypothetical protein
MRRVPIPRPNRKRLALAAAVAIGGGLLAAYGLRSAAQPKDTDFQPRKVLDPLPPITQFPVKPVREVGGALNPSELVLGVTVAQESRAYPINMLTGPHREILNDTLGGQAIPATW